MEQKDGWFRPAGLGTGCHHWCFISQPCRQVVQAAAGIIDRVLALRTALIEHFAVPLPTLHLCSGYVSTQGVLFIILARNSRSLRRGSVNR
jgi:hypothetical protein